MDIRRPAVDSLVSKSVAMSVRSPMGTNSDMLTMNTHITRAINGSHCLVDIGCLHVPHSRFFI